MKAKIEEAKLWFSEEIKSTAVSRNNICNLYKETCMKLFHNLYETNQFYFSVIKQEEEVNSNTEDILQTLLRRYTTKCRNKWKTELEAIKEGT